MGSVNTNYQPWYTSRRFQLIALIALAALALGEGFVAILLKDNDFLWHRHLGEAFLAGEPYASGGDHYLPARTMLNSLTAWLPYRFDRALVYIASLAALAWTLLAWQRLANQARPMDSPHAFAAIAFTLVTCGAYLQRDLDDCGLQIILLFLLTAAATSLHVGSPMRCGIWLALATVYKLTPFLFLPYLCYKRHWRAALWMGFFTVACCLAPAPWLGWDVNRQAHEHWWERTQAALSIADPSENGIEPPNHRNQSLTLALARLVQTYPPGHALHLDHPMFAQFGDLDPATAKRIVQCILLVLAVVLAWRFRKANDGAENFLREWATLIILAAILSPMCWLQHLVLVLPAVFLVVRAGLEPGSLSGRQRIVFWIAAIIMMFAGQRDLLGQSQFLLAMSYKVHTWAALALTGLVLTLPRVRLASRVTTDARPDLSVHPNVRECNSMREVA